jgi:purine nucleosidase
VRIHLDTDLGTNPDDVAALSLLLGWEGVDVVGITTTMDPAGRRAGYVRAVLELAGRTDIPVEAGAATSLTTLRTAGDFPDEQRYWGGAISPAPSPAGAALALLERSIEAGATVLAVGPVTNLAVAEVLRPGLLQDVVAMGGWVRSPADGYPAWGPARDWNVQCDPRAVAILVASCPRLTLVTLAATAQVHLRARDLGRLEAAGPVGRLLARQASAYAHDQDRAVLAALHARVPGDLLNFHHDPLAAAVAAGWPGAPIVEERLRPELDQDGVLRFVVDPDGRPTGVVSDVDGDAFGEVWLEAVEALARDR